VLSFGGWCGVCCGVLTEKRYSDKGRGIQLAGEEKVLTAGVHVGDSGDEQHVFQEKEKKGYGPETQLPDDLPDSSWGP